MTKTDISQALCYCQDCKKISGGSSSVNYIVPGEGFTSTGTKTFTKKADSGNEITSHFCGTCGSTLYRESPTFGTSKVVKVGTIDNIGSMDDAKPAAELFCGARPSWTAAVAGAQDVPGMPS